MNKISKYFNEQNSAIYLAWRKLADESCFSNVRFMHDCFYSCSLNMDINAIESLLIDVSLDLRIAC